MSSAPTSTGTGSKTDFSLRYPQGRRFSTEDGKQFYLAPDGNCHEIRSTTYTSKGKTGSEAFEDTARVERFFQSLGWSNLRICIEREFAAAASHKEELLRKAPSRCSRRRGVRPVRD